LETIASLTSYPTRINTVHLTIKSLLTQTKKADKVILFLADDQFPGRKLPKELQDLIPHDLTVDWYEQDIKSYKKLIPALKKYPHDIIVTFDDDQIYDKDAIKILYDFHQKNPKDIIAHRITRMYIKGKNSFTILPRDLYYQDGFNYADNLKRASYFNKLTGCSGVLYPPNSLYPDVLSEKLFMELAPTNDDIWFWLMGVLNKTRVIIPDNHIARLNEIPSTQKESLSDVNDHGGNLFFVQLNNIINHYPEIVQIMLSDNDANNTLVRTLSCNISHQIKRILKKISPNNILRHIGRI
jgi:hypothetical protein